MPLRAQLPVTGVRMTQRRLTSIRAVPHSVSGRNAARETVAGRVAEVPPVPGGSTKPPCDAACCSCQVASMQTVNARAAFCLILNFPCLSVAACRSSLTTQRWPIWHTPRHFAPTRVVTKGCARCGLVRSVQIFLDFSGNRGCDSTRDWKEEDFGSPTCPDIEAMSHAWSSRGMRRPRLLARTAAVLSWLLGIPINFSVAIHSACAMGAWQFRVCPTLLLLTALAATQVHLVPSSVYINRTTFELFLVP